MIFGILLYLSKSVTQKPPIKVLTPRASTGNLQEAYFQDPQAGVNWLVSLGVLDAASAQSFINGARWSISKKLIKVFFSLGIQADPTWRTAKQNNFVIASYSQNGGILLRVKNVEAQVQVNSLVTTSTSPIRVPIFYDDYGKSWGYPKREWRPLEGWEVQNIYDAINAYSVPQVQQVASSI